MQVDDLQNKIKQCLRSEINECIRFHNHNVKLFKDFLRMIDRDLNNSVAEIKSAFNEALRCVISALGNFSSDKYYVRIVCETLILGFRVHYKHLLNRLHQLCLYANILEMLLILHGWELVQLLKPDFNIKNKINNNSCSMYSYGLSVKVNSLDRIYSDIVRVFKDINWLEQYIFNYDQKHQTMKDRLKKINDDVVKATFFNNIYHINDKWMMKCFP